MGAKVGMLRGTDDTENPGPACDGARLVSYITDIRPLFGLQDRIAMMNICDLWSYDEVASHASTIGERIAEGSMPGVRPLTDAQVSMFDRWVAEGARP
jgi:hypothetical protein